MNEFVADVWVGVLAAGLYGSAWYYKARITDGEAFDSTKFGATLVVGLGVGWLFALSGASVTFEHVEAQLFALVGTISVVEALLKALYTYFHEGPEAARETLDDELGDDDVDEAVDEVRDAIRDANAAGATLSAPLQAIVEDRDERDFQANTHRESARYARIPEEHPYLDKPDRDDDSDRGPARPDGGHLPSDRGSDEFFGRPLLRESSDRLEHLRKVLDDADDYSGPARPDGGRRMSTNPELCDECGLSMIGGECLTKDCPASAVEPADYEVDEEEDSHE